MTEGVFAVDRGVFKHPIFANEPFTEREAWLWMLGTASWCSERKRVNRVIFELGRGQLVGASRHLAEKWQWDESKVRRYLGKLKKDRMIDVLPTRDATIITICNYNDYQFRRRTGDAQTDEPATDSRRTGDANKKELNNSITEESSLSEQGSDARKRNGLDYPQDFEKFWTAYPTDALMSKKQAYDAWKRLAPEDRAKAHSAAPSFAEHCRKNPDYRPLHAVRFLSQRRFDGFAATSTEPPAEQIEFMRTKGYELVDGSWKKVANGR